MSGPDKQAEPPEIVAPDLRELTEVLLATSDIRQALSELAVIAGRITPHAPMAGVTLRWAGQIMTVASSDAHALMIDEIQYDLDEQGGPCVTAINTGQITMVRDIVTEHRWGTYTAQMLTHGVRSIYSHPLNADGQTVAALNLYSPSISQTAFTRPTRQAIKVTAEHTGLLLQAVLRAARQAQLTEQLRTALASREIIHQALGIIMGQQRCTAHEGFELLRRASQNRNRPVYDLAADIVESITGARADATPFVDPDL
ncbi:GAF and ANTAR domain-containing protein [Nonomuraea rosea]|uniref:GAF and ANTAR domain-containing protein n=1 Tax=Nonomuraea rosea TaxID=638574 RepID=A0ABP6YS45_9ACTN